MEEPSRPGEGARCILWCADAAVVPSELLAALGRHGVSASRVPSPYLSLAEVCRHGGSRGDSPPGVRRGTVILVLIEPATLPLAADMIRAVSRYAPRAAVWVYESAVNSKLRAVVEEDVNRWDGSNLARSDNGGLQHTPTVVVRPGGGLDPRGSMAQGVRTVSGVGRINDAPRTNPPAATLRLSHDSRVDGGSAHADVDVGTDPGPDEPSRPSRPLLSTEELSMLLADDDTTTPERGHA
jgi:hypothetical protein